MKEFLRNLQTFSKLEISVFRISLQSYCIVSFSVSGSFSFSFRGSSLFWKVCGGDFAAYDEALSELIFGLRHAGVFFGVLLSKLPKPSVAPDPDSKTCCFVTCSGIYLEFFMDPPRGSGLFDAATSAWMDEAWCLG